MVFGLVTLVFHFHFFFSCRNCGQDPWITLFVAKSNPILRSILVPPRRRRNRAKRERPAVRCFHANHSNPGDVLALTSFGIYLKLCWYVRSPSAVLLHLTFMPICFFKMPLREPMRRISLPLCEPPRALDEVFTGGQRARFRLAMTRRRYWPGLASLRPRANSEPGSQLDKGHHSRVTLPHRTPWPGYC